MIHILVKEYQVKLNESSFISYLKESKSYLVPANYTSCNSPELIYRLMKDYVELTSLAEEEFYVIAMNSKSRILGLFMLSHGTVNATIASPREIFHRALLIGAANIVVVHNHPSLDTEPSRDDIMSTRRIKEAGDLIGIKLLDHIIVGDGYYSFKEHDGI